MDDLTLAVVWAAWAAAMTPLGFMLGSSCSPCCGETCGVNDGKPRTDPTGEGTWVPITPWPDLTVVGEVFQFAGIGVPENWTFVDRETYGPGNTWFFYGSAATSKVGGGATIEEQEDWGNICNWYSSRSEAPPSDSVPLQISPAIFTKRASRLPDENAVIHVYSPISTLLVGPQVVASAYFWFAGVPTIGSDITATEPILETSFVTAAMLFSRAFNLATVNGGVAFIAVPGARGGNGGNGTLAGNFTNSDGVVNGRAFFSGPAYNMAVVNGGAEFTRGSANRGGYFDGSGPDGGLGVVNGGALFRLGAINQRSFLFSGVFATVNDGAEFRTGGGNLGIVNGGAEFFDSSGNNGFVNGGAVFNDSSSHTGQTVNGGAIFRDTSVLGSVGPVVNGGAEFFDNSVMQSSGPFLSGEVNGGATFNDAACSQRSRTVGGVRFFVAHPTDFPVCNGTAPPGSNAAATCGCN